MNADANERNKPFNLASIRTIGGDYVEVLATHYKDDENRFGAAGPGFPFRVTMTVNGKTDINFTPLEFQRFVRQLNSLLPPDAQLELQKLVRQLNPPTQAAESR